MDPSLTTSYPSAILCRDKAMVVNLEHIKVCVWGGLF
jgi:magnesium transporter